MSDQGAGGPPPPGGPPQDGGWQEVHNPPPPGQPPPGYQAGPPPPGYVPPGYQPPPYGGPPYGQPVPGLTPMAAAAISYLTFIPAIVMLVIEPYKRDNYVRFHAWQCIVLSGVSVAGGMVLLMIAGMGMHWMMFGMHMLFRTILFIFWLIAIIKASQGERYHIPVVGDIAESLTANVTI